MISDRLYSLSPISSARSSLLYTLVLIEYSWFFRLFCAFTHADAKITQGKFALNTNMDYMALIRGMRMRGGAAETVDVAIPEGYTVSQIIELLAEKGVGTAEDLTEIAEDYVFEDYEFVDNENLGSLSRLEGYLFPDTYKSGLPGWPQCPDWQWAWGADPCAGRGYRGCPGWWSTGSGST